MRIDVDEEVAPTTYRRHLNRTESVLGFDVLDLQVGANLNGDVTAIVNELNDLDFDRLGDIDTLDLI